MQTIFLLCFSVWKKSPQIWFGGKRSADGLWRWAGKSTGVINIVLWAASEPNDYNGNEDCLTSALDRNQGYNGKTFDSYCGNTHPFVCEKIVN